MNVRLKIILIVAAVLLIIALGYLYFSYRFIKAFAPCEVTMNTEYIWSSCSFINGVSIAKLKVDSIGSGNYPVKYTVTHVASCYIQHPDDRPPDPPNRIRFQRPGKYRWRYDTVNISFTHYERRRASIHSPENSFLSIKASESEICPIKIEKEQWYFIDISNPTIIGVYFFIDKNGKENLYTIESGVSPI